MADPFKFRKARAQYVAWIDILGCSTLKPAVAERVWSNFHDLVRGIFAHDEVEIYGINDGFYLRGGDLKRMCDGAASLFRQWFDLPTSPSSRLPLLRGMIAHAPRDRVSCRPPIKLWLLGPGFRTTFEDEKILRGGRLFLQPSLARAHRLGSNNVYPWHELSEWQLPESERKHSLMEILWPFDPNEKQERFHARLRKAQRLHDKAFETYIREKKARPRLFMQ